ncbi:MAG TPA: 30S ribosome-binding factor RbfA [Sutterella sp.]|nr:30S ribosome-binding factor RbfA [Sutterella sp.]
MAPKKQNRAVRIADQLQKDLAKIIPTEVRDPRVGLVTITGCTITPDYAHAKVYFTVIGAKEDECLAALNQAAGMLRNKLFRLYTIHTVPTLHFELDTSIARGFEMDRVIERAIKVTEGECENS